MYFFSSLYLIIINLFSLFYSFYLPIYLKVFVVLLLKRHPSTLSGSIWSFIIFFTYIFSLVTVFTSIYFLSLFHLYFSYPRPSWVDFFFHVSAFSWLFLISLCLSFHIFSSVLFFVLLSCPPNRNSPRTCSVSSILCLWKDLLSIRHSSHLGQCRKKCSSVTPLSLLPPSIIFPVCIKRLMLKS